MRQQLAIATLLVVTFMSGGASFAQQPFPLSPNGVKTLAPNGQTNQPAPGTSALALAISCSSPGCAASTPRPTPSCRGTKPGFYRASST